MLFSMPYDFSAFLGWKIGVKKGGLLRFYLQELWNFRTFALSIRTMEFGRRAQKICFQAWQNFLPAQSVKKKSWMETRRDQNKNENEIKKRLTKRFELRSKKAQPLTDKSEEWGCQKSVSHFVNELFWQFIWKLHLLFVYLQHKHNTD